PAALAPDLGGVGDVGRILDPGLAERAERAVDRDDGAQRGGNPDDVHVERESPAGISDAAVAPAAGMPPTVAVTLESNEVRGARLARVRAGLSGHIREILAERDAPARHELALARCRYFRVREVASRDDR